VPPRHGVPSTLGAVTYAFDRYLRHDELTAWLRQRTDATPDVSCGW
jgi:hypothetical protein